MLVGLSCVAVSSRAHATDEEGWNGAIVPFLAFLGAIPGAVPYVAMFSTKDPGYGTLGLDMGAGQRATAFALSVDFGGYPRQDSRFGFMGRSHFDAFGKSGLMGLRLDALALVTVVGNARGPLVLEGIGGLTVAPHWLWKSALDSTVYAGVGPAAGMRIRAVAERPRLDADLELLYTPLFGEPLSERLHHASATGALGFSPGGGVWDAFTFELRGRVEWAWGGAGMEGGRPDASVVGGMRFHLGRVNKAAASRALLPDGPSMKGSATFRRRPSRRRRRRSRPSS
ncbi:MAG TPA: hypothetical protein VM694_25035 [Polyangium sp.]|nr:hypothetical protein [Polyangium sp.]